MFEYFLANNYLHKVNDGNTNARCETCSKPVIKTLEQHLWLGIRKPLIDFFVILVF